mmetsp:Transcript_18539/g.56182  ORF Transcript_18539/g.56182 Transcript_18539/m.56182 type:complete len:259 (+) Transcript_18539:1037-1813(+)
MSSRVCATMVPENCVTDALRPDTPKRRASKSEAARMRVKSVTIRRTTAGWRTLTATVWFNQTARWIWAMEPEAIGRRSKSSNSWSTGAPSASRTSRSVCLQPWRGACECSDARAAHMAVGKTSGRHDAHCPHLMKAVPARASEAVSMRYQTRLRKKGHSHASHESSIGGEKIRASTTARPTRLAKPGGASETSAASSRWPMISRSGGGRPRATERTAACRPSPPTTSTAGCCCSTCRRNAAAPRCTGWFDGRLGGEGG